MSSVEKIVYWATTNKELEKLPFIFYKPLANQLDHELKIIQNRELYWQEKAGEMANIANYFYNLIDESTLSENDVDQCHELFEKIKEYLIFGV